MLSLLHEKISHNVDQSFISIYMLQKDGRDPSHSGLKWSTKVKVENLAWDPHNEHSFVVHYAFFALLTDMIFRYLMWIVMFSSSILGESQRWNCEGLWYSFWFITKFHSPCSWWWSILHIIQHTCAQCTHISLFLSCPHNVGVVVCLTFKSLIIWVVVQLLATGSGDENVKL